MFSAAKLVELRERKGWNRHELARAAHVNYGTLTKIENGVTKNPTDDTRSKLAHALNVKPAVLQEDESDNGLVAEVLPHVHDPEIEELNHNALTLRELDYGGFRHLVTTAIALAKLAKQEKQHP